MKTHPHNWLPLYQEPNDPAFLNIYIAGNLNSFYHCQCGAIARKKDDKFRQLSRSKWRLHVTRSQQWTDNIKTFEAVTHE